MAVSLEPACRLSPEVRARKILDAGLVCCYGYTSISQGSKMRAVVQRVDGAVVSVDNKIISSIEKGMVVFVGIEKGDCRTDAEYLIEKVVNLRIFEDQEGKMNLSLVEKDGAMMIISQFTLLGDCRKGRRPSFFGAEEPEQARGLYDYFVSKGRERVRHVATGEFQAMMTIDVVNNGPVTILVDSRRVF